MRLYRIRRVSDGKWYGAGTRSGRDHWKPKNGKFFTLPALRAVLRGSGLRGVEVLEYLLDETKYRVVERNDI